MGSSQTRPSGCGEEGNETEKTFVATESFGFRRFSTRCSGVGCGRVSSGLSPVSSLRSRVLRDLRPPLPLSRLPQILCVHCTRSRRTRNNTVRITPSGFAFRIGISTRILTKPNCRLRGSRCFSTVFLFIYFSPLRFSLAANPRCVPPSRPATAGKRGRRSSTRSSSSPSSCRPPYRMPSCPSNRRPTRNVSTRNKFYIISVIKFYANTVPTVKVTAKTSEKRRPFCASKAVTRCTYRPTQIVLLNLFRST